MKKFIILTLLLLNFSILTESAKKTSQTNIKNSVDTKKIDEELELADDYYYGNKILKAKEIYEKYSPVSDEAKLKLAKYYIDDIQDEKSTVILEELARKKNKEALHMLGSLYLADNSEDKLIKLFNKKSRSDMDLLAAIYAENGYEEKASAVYRDLAISGDEDAYFYMISQYSYNTRVDLLKLESAKGKTRADKELGDLYSAYNDYKNAVNSYKKYLKNSKGSMEIFTIFGEYYSKEDLKKELAPYIKRGDKGAKEVLEEYLSKAEEGNVLDAEDEYSENNFQTVQDDNTVLSETDDDEAEDDLDFDLPILKTSFEENEKIYLDRITENPDDHDAVNELLSLYYLNDKKEKLNTFIDDLISDGYYLGENWKMVKDRAVPIYEAYITQGINRAKPVLAQIYTEKKDTEMALSIYESMLPSKNNNINLNIVDLYNRTQKYNKTLALIQDSGIDLNEEPKASNDYHDYDSYGYNISMIRLGAYAYYKLGDLDKAKTLYSFLSNSYDYGVSSHNQDSFYYPDKIYLLDIYKKTNAKEEYEELEKQLTQSAGFFSFEDHGMKQALADYYASNGDFDQAKKLLLDDKRENETLKALNFIPLVLGLFPNADFFGNSEQTANITLKYQDYSDIKNFIDEVLILTNNSHDNSKNYLNSVKIAALYIVKQYSEELNLSDSFKNKFLGYSDNTLKKEFKKSYKNLYKNKKGISFYPGNPDSNFMLSMLLKEWNVETKTLDSSENPVVTYSRRQIFENGILFFSDKYVKEFSHINDILEQEDLYEDTDETVLKNKSSKIGDAVDQFFSKTDFNKDYKDFFNLLPSMILVNIRENLEKNSRDDIIKKLDSDYAKYLTEDKIRTIEKIKESNNELKDKTNTVFSIH